MRPTSGITSPATQSSKVVFPAPDGPKRMVNPGVAWNSTSRAKSRSSELRRLWTRTWSVRSLASPDRGEGSARRLGSAANCLPALSAVCMWLIILFQWSDKPRPPVQTINQREHSEAEQQQHQRSLICGIVFRGLHAVEDIN